MLNVSGRAFEIDPNKSYIVAVMSAKDIGVCWSIIIQTLGPVTDYTHEPYSIDINGLQLPLKSWRELAGQVLDRPRFAQERESGLIQATIYRPEFEEHELLIEMELQIGRLVDGCCFDVKIDCLTSDCLEQTPDSEIVTFRGQLTFVSAIMHLNSHVDEIARAEQTLSRFFDPREFQKVEICGLQARFRPRDFTSF